MKIGDWAFDFGIVLRNEKSVNSKYIVVNQRFAILLKDSVQLGTNPGVHYIFVH